MIEIFSDSFCDSWEMSEDTSWLFRIDSRTYCLKVSYGIRFYGIICNCTTVLAQFLHFFLA